MPDSKDPEMQRYESIVNQPYHGPRTRQPMEIRARAAQFLGFDFMPGLSEDNEASARPTVDRIQLSEDQARHLDRKLHLLADHLDGHPEIIMTVFQPDPFKEGGNYVMRTGRVEKIDRISGALVLEQGDAIFFRDLLDVDGSLFMQLE